MCLSNKRPLWLQKVSKGGEKEEVRLEGPGTGRACRALKVIKVVRLSSPCLQGPTHPPTILREVAGGGEE